MKTSLVVYRTGNSKHRVNEWGHYNPLYLNLTKRCLDDIQGMRFDTIVTCSCVTDEDKETLAKYLSEDGVFI